MRTQFEAKAFLGRGWAFPVAAPQGSVAMAALDEDVRQAILIILGTNPGERIMRPDFGAGLDRFVFSPANRTALAAIETRVREALIDWEPRIDVGEVKVSAPPAEPGKVLIDISYRVRSTNTQANLVYPFYLQEGAAE